MPALTALSTASLGWLAFFSAYPLLLLLPITARPKLL
jgi:hypothetical protein